MPSGFRHKAPPVCAGAVMLPPFLRKGRIVPARVWGVDLIYEPDGALGVPAKLVLCVHKQQASSGCFLLPEGK